MKDKTEREYQEQIERCRHIFFQKSEDYGTSWRILRLPSITDQIFIKANRIRSIQEKGESKVDEGIEDAFTAIVNYCLMALIQIQVGSQTDDITLEELMIHYDKKVAETQGLLSNKNHDYDEAWRDMRVSSITDIILMKLLRVKQIEDNLGMTRVSEGVEGSYQDIINYAIFALIKLEQDEMV